MDSQYVTVSDPSTCDSKRYVERRLLYFALVDTPSLRSLTALLTRSKNWEKRVLPTSCMSVRPSFHPHGTTRLQKDGFL
jgi:hypothetical protein